MMPRSEPEHREEIVRVGRLMFDKGWIAANDGNISIRVGENPPDSNFEFASIRQI